MSELPILAEIERLADSGELTVARQFLRELLPEGETLDPSQLARAAGLAERLGLVIEATRLWQCLLEREPQDRQALENLFQAAQASGDLESALGYAQRGQELTPGDGRWIEEAFATLLELERHAEARKLMETLALDRQGDDPLVSRMRDALADAEQESQEQKPEDPPATNLPSDADLARFIHRFRGRENVYARMWKDGNDRIGYSPVNQPLTPRVARNHLLGNATVGAYLVRLDGSVCFFALDLDLAKEALRSAEGNLERARNLREKLLTIGRRIAEGLVAMDLDPLVESSGFKGRHFWVFLDPPQPADRIHALGPALLHAVDPRDSDLSLEFFPKQGARPGRLGNLIKLPLGIHLRTGRRSLILGVDGRPLPRPFERLRATRPLDPSGLDALERRLAASPREALLPSTQSTTGEYPAESQVAPPGPAPPAPGPAWTEADFQLDPPTASLLRGCELLSALVERIISHRAVNAEELAALRTTLGHLPSGPRAVNYLLNLCEEVPESAYLKKRLAGNPASCRRLRQRVAAALPGIECACEFPDLGASYPTPLLNVSDDPPGEHPAVSSPDPEFLARRLGWLERRVDELHREEQGVREAILQWMRANGEDRVTLEEGSWFLTEEEGVSCLAWRPVQQSHVPQGEEGSHEDPAG